MSEIAIKVEHVSKNFRLPHEKVGSVKNLFVNALRNIRNRRSYEMQHALRDVSFEVKKGEFFGIVGRNGSGKSTLLKMLAGIYQPTNGSIRKSGRLVPFIELGVGFNPELTGRQNVYLNGALLGFSEKEVDDLYDEVVAFAELEDFMDQKLKNYSSGMQVRLAFSMAVQAKADILLIDEVLAVGDDDFKRKCFNYFKNLKREHITVVFVSHDMGAVREYCDRAMLIESSRIIAIGETSKIADDYTKLFLQREERPQNGQTTHIAAQEREGSGIVRIINAGLTKTVLNDKDERLICKFQLKAFQDMKNPMVGIRIKNSAGQVVHETNTWNELIILEDMKVNEKFEIIWEFPNIYTDGQYVVDFYAYTDGNSPADIYNDALEFEVRLPKHMGTLVRPDFRFTVNKRRLR